MADIVDTLRNSGGDNVFPIAGGMKANSITTSMLKDGSVTSDKIDWTTVAGITTNSDGTAIKFGNGIMICFKTFGDGQLTTGATYGETVWNYPASFIDIPTFLAMPTRGTGDYAMYMPKNHNIQTTFAQCIWTNINNTVASGVTLYVTGHYAIGRWKA